MTMSMQEINTALTAPGQMFEVAEEKVRGLPVRVWKNAPPSLAAVLEQSRAHGDRTFTVYEGERTTFEEHFRQAAGLAHRLIDRYGVRKGDRVAIAMRNLPEWSPAFWAAAAAGAVVVPLNSWGTGPELAYGLADSGAKVLFADSQRIERLREHLPGLGLAGVIVARGEQVEKGHETFAAALGDLPDEIALPDVAIEPDDDATIFYTSGTTGKPKGALGTHRNVCGNLVSLAFATTRGLLRAGTPLPDPTAPREQPAALLSVPLFHVTGCHGVLVGMTAFGGKIVLMHKWDPERALELIEQERITTFGGVPTMVWQLLDSPSLADRDISSLNTIGYGGAPASPELLRRIAKAIPGSTPSNGYGLTETSSLVTLNSGGDYLERPDSPGMPIPICDVKVVAEDGKERPRGELGEFWIRGASVVKGYWNKPDATAASFTDGWFHTGDLGRIDEDGFLYIVDRLKDIIIRAGENIYGVEIENALLEHPDVLDVAVIGIPHEVLGEEVGAVAQVRPGATPTEEDLRSHVAARLAAFKVPSKIRTGEEPLPRNAAGKVLKRELRETLT